MLVLIMCTVLLLRISFYKRKRACKIIPVTRFLITRMIQMTHASLSKLSITCSHNYFLCKRSNSRPNCGRYNQPKINFVKYKMFRFKC